MKISKTNFSRLKTTDFNNLKFGTVFSDHMCICKYIDGKWGFRNKTLWSIRNVPRFSNSSLWTS